VTNILSAVHFMQGDMLLLQYGNQGDVLLLQYGNHKANSITGMQYNIDIFLLVSPTTTNGILRLNNETRLVSFH